MATPRFAVGQRVRIDDRFEPRHHRTPAYVKGRSGIVERICLPHGRPEVVGYDDQDSESYPVYRVRLAQGDLWPGYRGAPDDCIEIEIFENWLQADEGAAGATGGSA